MEKEVIIRKSTAMLILIMMILNVVGMSYPSFALTHNDTTANLFVDRFQDGGEESSGILNDLEPQYIALYDRTRYAYKIGETGIYRIKVDGEENDKNSIYCIEQSKEFPGRASGSITYTNRGDFTNRDNTAVQEYMDDIATTSSEKDKKYFGILQIMYNMYLKNQAPEQKEQFLKKAFKKEIESDEYSYDVIKVLLTDDDINVVQQYALWFYTEQNIDDISQKYSELFTNGELTGSLILPSVNRYINDDNETDSIDSQIKIMRKELMDKLYTYLVASSLKCAMADGEGLTPDPSYDTKITIWTPESSNYQRVVLIEKEKPISPDLALRKYISAVSKDLVFDNEDYLTGDKSREPVVDYSKLDSGDRTTAIYNQSKSDVEVDLGDYILYTIRVYNEGDVDAKAASIVDYLPNGLEFVECGANSIWTYDSTTGKISTNDDYRPELIAAHEKGKDLSYEDVQIVCRVKTDASADSNFLNLAEITKITDENDNDITDEDSTPDNVEYPDNPSSYDGGDSPDKSDDYKPGQEDDDDFDRVKIRSKFDLSLRKFIAAISKDDSIDEGEWLTSTGNATGIPNRAPIIDTSKLNTLDSDNKEVTTAIYSHSKEPVKVSKGDTILYEIRVYNEGDIDGYVNEVTDYLPEYLEFLPNNEFNKMFGWKQDESDSQKITTDILANNNIEYYIPGSSTDNSIIRAFNKETGKLDSKYLYIACKVKEDAATNKNITNIAEISDAVDARGNKIVDRDSTPDNLRRPSDPSTYEGGTDPNKTDNYIPGQEDDDDFDRVIIEEEVKEYDLALVKFISAISVDDKFEASEYLTGDKSMAPTVDYSKLDDGTSKDATYNMKKNTLEIQKGNYVLYTIRVYNEGPEDAKATEVTDMLPNGLDFVANHDMNKIWTYDSNTRKVVTNNNYNAKLLKGHQKGVDLYYDELVIVCQVSNSAEEGKDIKNVAEITKETDKDGNPVTDRDSTPNNYNPNGKDNQEDDDDFAKLIIPKPVEEKIYDLALKKFISAVSKDNKFEMNEFFNGDKSMAPVVNYSNLDNGKSKDATYTIKKTSINVEPTNYILYTIRVFNEGPEDAVATEITDILPEGLEFVSDVANNKIWTYNSSTRKVVTNQNYKPTVIKGHEKGKDLSFVDVQIVCKVAENAATGKDLKNTAEITNMTDKDGNKVKDRDSTPNNYNPNGKDNQEDDDDYALINVLKTETPIVPTVVPEEKKNNPVPSPATGDILPVVAGAVIAIVVIANVAQIVIKKKKDDGQDK